MFSSTSSASLVRHVVNPHHVIARMTSNTSAISGFSDADGEEVADDDEDGDGLLMLGAESASARERREYGRIGRAVYTEYIRAAGPHLAAAFLVLSIAAQALKVYMDFLLRDWSLAQDPDADPTDYFALFSACSVAVLALSCAANLLGQVSGARARRRLHAVLVRNLLRCPLELFEAR